MNRRPSTSHYKAVYIPVQQAPKEVNLPPVQRFGPAEHLKALEKLFAKDRTEQGRAAKNINANGSAHPPSTEAGVASGWKDYGFPRLTVLTDSNAIAGGMERNIVATKV